MSIDVENHMWVGVFSAAFVQQHAEATKIAKSWHLGAQVVSVDRFVKEAAALADEALEAYQRMCARNAVEA